MVFDRFFGKKPAPTLPIIGDAGLGRAVRIDPSMLRAVETALGEPVSPDMVITAHGVVEMPDDQGTVWLHRFYDDDHRMLQAMTESAEGGPALEWSFYVPAGSEHLAAGETVSAWKDRLSRPEFAHEGEPYARLWYEGDDREQPAVRFAEVVYEASDMTDGRTLVQDCMVYGRDTEQGELLLLAIVMGEGREATLERMLGTGLRPHQVGV